MAGHANWWKGVRPGNDVASSWGLVPFKQNEITIFKIFLQEQTSCRTYSNTTKKLLQQECLEKYFFQTFFYHSNDIYFHKATPPASLSLMYSTSSSPLYSLLFNSLGEYWLWVQPNDVYTWVVPISLSRFWWCTVVIEDVIFRRSWVKCIWNFL